MGAVVAVQDRWSVGHEQLADRGRGARSGDAAVDAGHAGLLPQGEMEVGDVAEADEGLGVTTDGVAVEAVEDAIGAGSAPSRDDGPHLRIVVSGVEVLETVPVAPGHVAALVKSVPADVDHEAPVGEDRGRCQDPALVGVAGR